MQKARYYTCTQYVIIDSRLILSGVTLDDRWYWYTPRTCNMITGESL